MTARISRFCLSVARTQVPGKLLGAVLLLLLFNAPARAQAPPSALSQLLDQYKIESSLGLQLWATYGYGMQVIGEDGTATEAEARLNTQLRRSRFTLSGQPYSTVNFKVTAALDLVGHDILGGTESGANNGSSPRFRLWNAWVKWQRKPEDDRLHLVAGYFVAPIGRESNNSALASTSFEKAWSQNYLRRHLTATGPGRATGLMLAGQFHGAEGDRHLVYELALQNPLFTGMNGNSTGLSYSPMVSGRLALQLGDAEQARYQPGNQVNYFGARRGVTLGVAAARQGTTDLFGQNAAYGLDWLANTAHWQLDGELYRLERTGLPADGDHSVRSDGYTGYLRLGRNLSLPRSLTLEPVLSFWFFRGATTLSGIAAANQLESFSGHDSGLDIGANLYFNPRTKLSLFYALRQGDAGAGNPATVNNNYYRQPGAGVVERGDYVGLGWVATF